jgi:predicted enzyme related to lactoylglutathione lyase/catechol 2,3-dioxygenase-like lactoylglutathione lyase family enzyme
MAVTIGWWTVDVQDAPGLARFWEELLGWQRLFEDPDEGIALVPPGEPRMGQGFLLYTEHETGPEQGKNPAHLDLRPADQAAAVGRALTLGATRADVGQGDDVSWEVLADPEGNEFCILAADGSVGDGLHVESWALDVGDVGRAVAFWGGLLGWEEVLRGDDYARLGDPTGEAIPLDLLYTPDVRATKNRVHPDLVPAGDEDDDDARPRVVARALDLGARRVDIGQGDVTWEVLADPEDNEFCVLGPRGWQPGR